MRQFPNIRCERILSRKVIKKEMNLLCMFNDVIGGVGGGRTEVEISGCCCWLTATITAVTVVGCLGYHHQIQQSNSY